MVWNGPMGVFENPVLAKGTITVAKALLNLEAITIVGGGDLRLRLNSLALPTRLPIYPQAAHPLNS